MCTDGKEHVEIVPTEFQTFLQTKTCGSLIQSWDNPSHVTKNTSILDLEHLGSDYQWSNFLLCSSRELLLPSPERDLVSPLGSGRKKQWAQTDEVVLIVVPMKKEQ